jgi:hypothetical protein
VRSLPLNSLNWRIRLGAAAMPSSHIGKELPGHMCFVGMELSDTIASLFQLNSAQDFFLSRKLQATGVRQNKGWICEAPCWTNPQPTMGTLLGSSCLPCPPLGPRILLAPLPTHFTGVSVEQTCDQRPVTHHSSLPSVTGPGRAFSTGCVHGKRLCKRAACPAPTPPHTQRVQWH